MSNEEKILAMLAEMQSDIKNLQSDIDMLKNNKVKKVKKVRPNAKEQIAILDAMRNLLNDEEKESLRRYQEAEETRKRALYG